MYIPKIMPLKDNRIILLTGILVFSVLLRFFMLSYQSLWFDEGATLKLSYNLNLLDNIKSFSVLKTGDRFQPLYYWLMPYWRFLFGDSEFALRSLSALLGSVTVILLSLTALRFYGMNHALWVALIATSSAFAVFYSQDARPYALLIFIATLQLYFFSNTIILGKNDSISRWGFWITTMFGLFGSILIGIFTAALSLSHLITYRDWRSWLRWWIPAILFALPAILFYFSSELSTDPTSVATTRYGFFLLKNLLFVLYGIAVGQTYGPPIDNLHTQEHWQVISRFLPELLVLLVVGTIIVICLFKQLATSSKRSTYDWFFLRLFLISLILGILFAVVTKINWLPRHAFYLWIPFVLLLPSIRSLNVGFLAKGVLIMLIICNVYALSNYFWKDVYRKDDFRAVAQYINTYPEVASVIVWGFQHLLAYYGDHKTLDATFVAGEHLAHTINQITASAPTVLVIVNNEFFWKKREKMTIKKALRELYTFDSQVSFPNFIIYRFDLKQQK
jgi:uncharacterized membrane protein